MSAALSRAGSSQLVVVDVQERLCSVMDPDALVSVVKCSGILLQAATLLNVPVICTEQYPKGLGATLPELAPYLHAPAIEKICFSCGDEQNFIARLNHQRPQIVLVGMEAHICILQTALHLQQLGYQPYVVEDAVISRNPEHKANALSRLRQAGVVVSNTESVVFEWLRVAEGDAFKQISRLVR